MQSAGIVVDYHVWLTTGNWSNGMRRIIAACYSYYGRSVGDYVLPELEDPSERKIIPDDLSHPPMPPSTPLRTSTPRHSSNLLTSPCVLSPLPPTPRRPTSATLSPLPPTLQVSSQSPPFKRTKLSHNPKQFTPLAVRRPRRNL